MANPYWNKQVAQKRGAGRGWETKGINEYGGSGRNAAGDYDQHNSANHAGAYDMKMEKVMHEYKTGTLHSGSKSGPKVGNRKQAIAIAMSEAKKARAGGY